MGKVLYRTFLILSAGTLVPLACVWMLLLLGNLGGAFGFPILALLALPVLPVGQHILRRRYARTFPVRYEGKTDVSFNLMVGALSAVTVAIFGAIIWMATESAVLGPLRP